MTRPSHPVDLSWSEKLGQTSRVRVINFTNFTHAATICSTYKEKIDPNIDDYFSLSQPHIIRPRKALKKKKRRYFQTVSNGILPFPFPILSLSSPSLPVSLPACNLSLSLNLALSPFPSPLSSLSPSDLPPTFLSLCDLSLSLDLPSISLSLIPHRPISLFALISRTHLLHLHYPSSSLRSPCPTSLSPSISLLACDLSLSLDPPSILLSLIPRPSSPPSPSSSYLLNPSASSPLSLFLSLISLFHLPLPLDLSPSLSISLSLDLPFSFINLPLSISISPSISLPLSISS